MGPGGYRTYVFELDEGGVGLIDATMNPEAVSAKEILVELGKTSEDVRAILFTHGHNDHTAGAFAFPDAELYTLERRIPSIEAAGRRLNILADGERVNLSGTIVEVFHVPGHTNGSTAYLVHNVLFVRDSAGAARRGTVAPNPLFSEDSNLNEQSLRNLAERLESRKDEIRHIASVHQGPVEGLSPLLDWAQRR